MAPSDNIIYRQSEAPADMDAEAADSAPSNIKDTYIESLYANNTTKNLYNKRLRYKNAVEISTENYSNVVDFNFAEKHLYGRTSRLFVPMVVSDPRTDIINIRGSKFDGNFRALNFVEESFNEMTYQFKKSVMSKKISAADPYLSELQVYKAYEDPYKLYSEHLKIYKDAIDSIFKDSNTSIINFNDFLAKLMPYLKKTARKQPFTFPAFVKSNYCPAHVSGLVIEIADISPAADVEKILKLTYSPNWEYYLNACRSYGFMVDKLYPGRLVADIASSPMLQKAAVHGIGSTDKILRVVYRPAHRGHYREFRNIMLRFYNQTKYPSFEAVNCGSSRKVSVKTTRPLDYTPAIFRERYSDLFFFRLYCTIRFVEEESPFTDNEKHILLDDCMELFRISPRSAIDAFERILNKTFDYMGSLSYIKKKFDRIDLSKQG
jgi:hypothetical protein